MSVKFIHTADLQLAKPYGSIQDENKRVKLKDVRFDVFTTIKKMVEEHGAKFVVIAGDMFDSTTPTNYDVSQACSLIGAINVPVYVIPGNHDHGGKGSVWYQDFFIKEQPRLAPNLIILLEPKAIEIEHAILFPCPLLRRHEYDDLTAWLRTIDSSVFPASKPKIILAHGTTQDFSSGSALDDEYIVANFIDLVGFPENEFDYIALGDWHGTKKVGPKAWYAGTPEIDRFIKGAENKPGHVLLVEADCKKAPVVTEIRTTKVEWYEKEFEFIDENSLDIFIADIKALFGTRVAEDLLKLTLTGHLGLADFTKLEEQITTLESRMINLKLDNRVSITPTNDEIESLKNRLSDPLISSVADKLIQASMLGNEDAEIATVALRELYAACK
jgi:DNA repair exonuclease SbcCD nuclease subunit